MCGLARFVVFLYICFFLGFSFSFRCCYCFVFRRLQKYPIQRGPWTLNAKKFEHSTNWEQVPTALTTIECMNGVKCYRVQNKNAFKWKIKWIFLRLIWKVLHCSSTIITIKHIFLQNAETQSWKTVQTLFTCRMANRIDVFGPNTEHTSKGKLRNQNIREAKSEEGVKKKRSFICDFPETFPVCLF